MSSSFTATVTMDAHLAPIDTTDFPLTQPPSPMHFGDNDYMEAPELAALADVIIEHAPEMGYIGAFTVRYAWKRKGSGTGDKITAGKCVKASGPLALYSGADFIVWLAADVFRDQPTRTIAAALYHELCHVGMDPETEEPVARKHDWEGFIPEIERFGLWRLELQHIASAVRQLPLGITG